MEGRVVVVSSARVVCALEARLRGRGVGVYFGERSKAGQIFMLVKPNDAKPQQKNEDQSG